MTGASVGDVSRRYRVCKSLIYRRRRLLLRDGEAVQAAQLPAPAFVPVEGSVIAHVRLPQNFPLSSTQASRGAITSTTSQCSAMAPFSIR